MPAFPKTVRRCDTVESLGNGLGSGHLTGNQDHRDHPYPFRFLQTSWHRGSGLLIGQHQKPAFDQLEADILQTAMSRFLRRFSP